MESTDDFERFRQIAQRSARASLSPYDHRSQDASLGRRATYGDYLESPFGSNVKRASSFRESTSYKSGGRVVGSLSSKRSPASPSPSRVSPHPHGPYETRRESLGPVRSRDLVRSGQREENITTTHIRTSPTAGRTNRDRGGSMKEVKKYERSKAGYRPSAPPTVFSTLAPANIPRESHSPSRYSVISSEDSSMVRVRRFQRKKDGQVVSRGDHDVPEAHLYQSAGSPFANRQSLNYMQSGQDTTNPKIYTNEPSDQSSSSQTDDNEVVEIPAITTTLVQSASHTGYTGSPVAGHRRSKNTLHPEFRNRSRSWAFVAQPALESPQSCPSPQSDGAAPSNEILVVQVLGISRVGKTSLCRQFQTSESLDVTIDNGLEDEQTRTVVIEINGEHFNLEFVDTDFVQDEFQANAEPTILETADAYLVVYAIDDRASFIAARSILSSLLGQCKRSSAIILAANKSDLVRTRAVSDEEGKNLAAVYASPFFETSTSLNHRVDDLLVGVVVAIQEQRREVEKERARLERIVVSNKHGSVSTAAAVAAAGVGRRASLGLVKPRTNSLLKFFHKHFPKKDKQAHGLV